MSHEEYSAFHIRSDPEGETRRLELERVYKNWARSDVQYAIKNGILKRKPCLFCGKEKSEAHHENYSFPLQVIWVCRQHHAKLDVQKRSREREIFYPQQISYNFPNWEELRKNNKQQIA